MNEILKTTFPEQVIFPDELDLRDIEGWSSLASFVLIMTIDEQLGVQLSEQEFKQCKTIGDLKALCSVK